MLNCLYVVGIKLPIDVQHLIVSELCIYDNDEESDLKFNFEALTFLAVN